MTQSVISAVVWCCASVGVSAAESPQVDFRYAPPQWQAAICLPDDPHKSLVDKSGALLYHYRMGGREFGTLVSVDVDASARWQKQQLHSPRVPIVRSFRTAPGLQIVEEAFAVTDLPQPRTPPPPLRRVDRGGMNRNWAKPEGQVDPSLGDIAIRRGGAIEFETSVKPGGDRRVALALCEGWWGQPGKRVQISSVEGAQPQTVDLVADIGKNRAAAFWFAARDTDGDGNIGIRVEAAPHGADKHTVLNGLWIFDAGLNPDDQALLAGRLNSRALATLKSARPGGPARNDLIVVHLTNTSNQPRELQPRLIVDTAIDFAFQPHEQRVVVNSHETITASLRMTGVQAQGKTRRAVQLEPLALPAGGSAKFFVLYSGGSSIVIEPRTVEQALAARDRAVAYWEQAPLPYGRVQVPDVGIQALLEAAARNIWQAREIKKGLPAFQVGPTCYRGLWIVDGAFLLEAATLLGAGDQARNGVAYELTYQQPDGRIEVMKNFSKENGIVLWTCLRHAQLTRDKAWLASVWPKLERVAEHIRRLRRETLHNDSPLDDGLVPPGIPDGGIGGVQLEYTNAYWNLLGLRAFVGAAQWLGRTAQAAEWQREYDDFLAAFRKAAARDLRKDAHGNAYLPTLMGELGAKELPQRGQWAFCQAVYPGQVFASDDPLVVGNLAMLAATEREGMVYGTGWDATGIWNYFASFYGHAWLWQGNGRKAAEALYAFANHAAPVLDWREEQSLQGETFKKVGDMPHNWASAEFVRLTVHLLALDRGDELHLFQGLPTAWLKPGMVTRLEGVPTPFGALVLRLEAGKNGRAASLAVGPLSDPACRKIVVHWPDETGQLPTAATTRASQSHTLVLPLRNWK